MRDLLQFNVCELESSFILNREVLDLLDHIQIASSLQFFYACRYWGKHLPGLEYLDELVALSYIRKTPAGQLTLN
jgi:hypothetical protein